MNEDMWMHTCNKEGWVKATERAIRHHCLMACLSQGLGWKKEQAAYLSTLNLNPIVFTHSSGFSSAGTIRVLYIGIS